LKTERFGKIVDTTHETSLKHHKIAGLRLSGKAQGDIYADGFRSVIS
jgi:hypothetical protein